MSTATQLSAADSAQSSIPVQTRRNIAVDAYRGLVMLLMMAEVLELARVAHAFPGNGFWAFSASTRRTWNGPAARCTT